MLKRTLVTLAISLLLAPGVVIFAMMLLSERPRETLLVPWSHDGEWIAFSCGWGIDHETHAIYRMRPDGKHVQQVTSSGSIDGSPTWSPDGEWIAFASQRYDLFGEEDDYEIYRIRPDGTDLQQLTDNSSIDDSPTWSPDGKLIAFMSNREGDGHRRIYLMDSGTKETRLLDSYTFNPSWSADSQWLIVTKPGTAIYQMRRDGSDKRFLSYAAILGEASWSPDGQWIVFPAWNKKHMGTNLTIMRIDGSQRRQLMDEAGSYSSPTWSPDGQWIAFSHFSLHDGSQIYKIRPDGTDRQQLTHADCNAWSPAWSPDFDQLPKREEADF